MNVGKKIALLAALTGAVSTAIAAQLLENTNAPAKSTPQAAAFNFNFDQVEIRLLVKLAGEMTGRRFIVDDKVAGKVTVVSPERLSRDEVLPLLQSALEASGFSLSDRGDAVHVVPLAKGEAAGTVIGADMQTPISGFVTKVIKVNHVSAIDLKKLLDPLIRGGKEGAVAAFPGTNHLIITDTADNVRQAEKIIAELDKAGASRTIQVIQLTHSSADEIAQQVMSAIRGADTAGANVARHLQQVGEGMSGLPSDVLVVPSPQSGSVVVIGTPLQLEDVKKIIAMLDVEPKTGQGRLHAIFLKYLLAEDAAKSLTALLTKTVDKDKHTSIALESSAANNALLVDASSSDFQIVSNLVAQLDTMPEQVLVEIVIAEVSADHDLNLGVELNAIDQPKAGKVTVAGRSRPGSSDPVGDATTSGTFPQGLLLGVANGTYANAAGTIIPNIPIAIQALAQDTDVKILSNVPLWAQNNAEATVNVVDNIPVLRSTIAGGSGTARDVIQNIDRMDVGIKLKVTPHVNPNNEITLKLNPSIEAITDNGVSGSFSPTIARRDVTTTVTVSNDATVIISGLLREDRVNSTGKTPLLGDIPILGWLFKSKSDSLKRTNLLIFVTPHIVTDAKQAAAFKQEWQKKTQIDPNMPVPAGRKSEK